MTDQPLARRRRNDEERDHDANIRSADQRATALAAVASLASSLALAGVALIIDTSKWTSPPLVRYAFGALLLLAVFYFPSRRYTQFLGIEVHPNPTHDRSLPAVRG